MIQKFFSGSEIRRRRRLLCIKKAREVEFFNSPELLGDSFSVKMTLDFLSERCRSASFPDPFFVNAYWPSGSSKLQTQLLLHVLREAGYACLLLIPLQRATPLLRFAPWTPNTVLVQGPSRMAVLKRHSFEPYGATFCLFRFQVSSFFLAVGLGYSSQEISPVPRECHGEKMDVLLTENKCFWF